MLAIHLQPTALQHHRDPGHRPSREGAQGVSAVGEIPAYLPVLPNNACGPGGRGAEGEVT